MTEEAYFRQLAGHDEWANRRVIEALRAMPSPPQRSLDLIAHIIGTGWLWLSRIHHTSPEMKVWPGISLEDCERQLPKLREAFDRLATTNLDATYPYTNSKGEHFESNVRDTMSHVFLHSHYHRGQIVYMIRQAGFEPPYIDFIESVRKGYVTA